MIDGLGWAVCVDWIVGCVLVVIRVVCALVLKTVLSLAASALLTSDCLKSVIQHNALDTRLCSLLAAACPMNSSETSMRRPSTYRTTVATKVLPVSSLSSTALAVLPGWRQSVITH